jgi:hypothetical protein
MTTEQSWTNPFDAEYERRKAEVLAMPGFEFKLDLEALGRAGHVLIKNADARKALNTVIRAIVAGESVDSYAKRQRDEYRQRIQNLTQQGDLTNLFKLTP